MKFIITPSNLNPTNRFLIYRLSEFSFDIEPASSESFASLLINDLNIEVDKKGKVVSVWGLSSNNNWLSTSLLPPLAAPAIVQMYDFTSLKSGTSIRLDSERWPVYTDTTSGWIVIRKTAIAVCFAEIISNVIFGFDAEDRLVELWLNPIIEL